MGEPGCAVGKDKNALNTPKAALQLSKKSALMQRSGTKQKRQRAQLSPLGPYARYDVSKPKLVRRTTSKNSADS